MEIKESRAALIIALSYHRAAVGTMLEDILGEKALLIFPDSNFSGILCQNYSGRYSVEKNGSIYPIKCSNVLDVKKVQGVWNIIHTLNTD